MELMLVLFVVFGGLAAVYDLTRRGSFPLFQFFLHECLALCLAWATSALLAAGGVDWPPRSEEISRVARASRQSGAETTVRSPPETPQRFSLFTISTPVCIGPGPEIRCHLDVGSDQVGTVDLHTVTGTFVAELADRSFSVREMLLNGIPQRLDRPEGVWLTGSSPMRFTTVFFDPDLGGASMLRLRIPLRSASADTVLVFNNVLVRGTAPQDVSSLHLRDQ